jgi:hypothetical protein
MLEMELFQDDVECFFANASELGMTVDEYIKFASRRFDVNSWRSAKSRKRSGKKYYGLGLVSEG